MSNERKRNTDGINDFLWAVQEHLDAIPSGRTVVFGSRRNTREIKPEKLVITAEDIKKLIDSHDDNEKQD